jgi:hypothetical protein
VSIFSEIFNVYNTYFKLVQAKLFLNVSGARNLVIFGTFCCFSETYPVTLVSEMGHIFILELRKSILLKYHLHS